MKTLEVDTDLIPAHERLDAWRASLFETFGPMHVEPLADRPLTGSLKSKSRGAFSFHSMRYRGMGMWRKPVDVAHLGGEFFTLTRPSSGVLHVVQLGEERKLEAGHTYLFNHAVTYRTTPESEYRTASVAFPAELLRQRIGSLDTFYDLNACCPDKVGPQLIGAFAEHLSSGAVLWTDHEYITLVDQFLDLIGLFLRTPRAIANSTDSSTRTGHRARAIQYIRVNASDLELTPSRVAAACGISLSYLHDVFRAAGMSVEERIFDERLEIARRLLIDPRKHGIPIGTLSYESGFSDPAHFSRTFKRRFGVTPGELRRTAMEARSKL